MSTPVDPLSPESLARLRELAQECLGESAAWSARPAKPGKVRLPAPLAFTALVSPGVVVALVDEVERLRAALASVAQGTLTGPRPDTGAADQDGGAA